MGSEPRKLLDKHRVFHDYRKTLETRPVLSLKPIAVALTVGARWEVGGWAGGSYSAFFRFACA